MWWRRDVLLEAGYDLEAADALALREDVDLHDAVRLVQAGCVPPVALRILL